MAGKKEARHGTLAAPGKRGRGALIDATRFADPDDILTREESALVAKRRREMRQGKYVTLAELEHELARKRPPRSRKTA